MSERRLRVGVTGAGFGAAVHVPAFRLQPGCEVVAICGAQADEVAAVAAKLAIPWHGTDFRRMLETEALDLVTFALPPRVQAELALYAAERGVALFCEKPMAADLDAAVRLAAAAKAHGVPGMVDFEFIEVPAWKKTKELLEGKHIGELHAVQVRWRVATYANKIGAVSWKTTAADGGGALFNFGSHCLHYLEWLAGPLTQLGARLSALPHDTRAGDTRVDLVGTHASGAHASVLIDTAAFCHQEHLIELLGSKGSLCLSNDTKDYARGFKLSYAARDGGRWEEIPVALPSLLWSDAAVDGRIPAVGAMAGALLARIGGAPLGTAADLDAGVRVQGRMAAAVLSSRAGGAVVPVA